LYQRVSVNESNQAEELPAAESCMTDDEEEFGEVRH
jgi:Tfp pilus assembly protein PilX